MGEVFRIACHLAEIAFKWDKQIADLMEDSEWADQMDKFGKATKDPANARERAILDQAFYADSNGRGGSLQVENNQDLQSAVESLSYTVYSQFISQRLKTHGAGSWYGDCSLKGATRKQAAYVKKILDSAAVEIELLDAVAGNEDAMQPQSK